MGTLIIRKALAGQPNTITLQQLVSRAIAGVMPIAIRNKSFIINEIAPGLQLAGNSDMISTVLHKLIDTVSVHSMNSCIRVSAKAYGNVILVQVRDHHSADACTLAFSLEPAQPVAEKIGGYLGITSQWRNETTIVFSFPNVPEAA